MILALDFDNTFTLAPNFWKAVLQLASTQAIQVLLVTCRKDNPRNLAAILDALGDSPIKIIFTDNAPKLPHLNNLGIQPDIWIDDDPLSVLYGKMRTCKMSKAHEDYHHELLEKNSTTIEFFSPKQR